RMASVGNWSRLQQAREQGFYADAALNVARADHAALRSREALTRLLGVWGTQTAYTLPERLPDLPKEPVDQPDIEQRAMQSRLDVQGAKLSATALASNLGLSKATRFINVLEVGGIRDMSNQQPTRHGYEISLELPLFDWGAAKFAKAEALYMQAVNRAAEIAINARSEVRESYQGYRITYDIARHYRDEVVPVRKRIADENLLRYNGMLIGVFDLLSDARSQIGSVNSYIEALRDFWLAENELQMAMIGKPAGTDMPRAMMVNDAAAGGH
ncbi:MAG: TolC family protein, partial [Usitatibacteraceae bacterium]